jgi:hypothetical protein
LISLVIPSVRKTKYVFRQGHDINGYVFINPSADRGSNPGIICKAFSSQLIGEFVELLFGSYFHDAIDILSRARFRSSLTIDIQGGSGSTYENSLTQQLPEACCYYL